MAGSDTKRDYRPLLLPGFTDVGLDRLEDFFASPFRNPERRIFLLNRFAAFVHLLKGFGIPLELWLDGSFVTQKPEPDDIDLLILASRDSINNLSIPRKTAFRMLFQDSTATKLRYGCHAFFVGLEDDILRADWTAFFGKDRSGQPKGLARCRI